MSPLCQAIKALVKKPQRNLSKHHKDFLNNNTANHAGTSFITPWENELSMSLLMLMLTSLLATPKLFIQLTALRSHVSFFFTVYWILGCIVCYCIGSRIGADSIIVKHSSEMVHHWSFYHRMGWNEFNTTRSTKVFLRRALRCLSISCAQIWDHSRVYDMI